MTRLLLALTAATFATLPAAAQTGIATIDSPAAYRQAGLRGPEHARLVRELLRYELRNMRSLIVPQIALRPSSYSFILTNRATVAEVIGGAYTVTYYNAQGQALDTTTGRFGGMAPGASRNQTVTFARPADAIRAQLTVAEVTAE
ncbi:hypothetical protein GCM10011495_10040 [Hymenobacter frigidus]|jgi:hypothetical protein|uniref:Uncharacterized protein n=1 Tax=Hymenobacter frigidus TaxID=1524095 RepID=A0ABQ2A143_9BACT|nr:hypothetical protein [Hymenobacter frigidus]GGH82187.1 hypothetical protein GCM10011495_10040 [Hymenobacter frigidus]